MKRPSLQEAARSMHALGLSPLPLRMHHSPDPKRAKAPCLAEWSALCDIQPHTSVIDTWFTLGMEQRVLGLVTQVGGIGVACGMASGQQDACLVCLDYDAKAFGSEHRRCHASYISAWNELLESHPWLEDILDEAPSESTRSGGRHWYVRVLLDQEREPIPPPRSVKIIERKLITDDGEPVLDKRGQQVYVCPLELRGRGAQAACWPTEGYELVSEHWLESIPSVPEKDFIRMLATFGTISERERRAPKARSSTSTARLAEEGESVIDAYNRTTDIRELLEARGWTYVEDCAEGEKWLRPDDGIEITSASSATLMEADGERPQLLYVWTTSTELYSERAYNAFQLYTQWEHDGDASAAYWTIRRETLPPVQLKPSVPMHVSATVDSARKIANILRRRREQKDEVWVEVEA